MCLNHHHNAGGMFRNADFCNIYYPGWTCRVYVDAVEKGAIEEHLLHDGAQLMLLPTLANGQKMDPMIARHMVAADPDVDRFIVRELTNSLLFLLILSEVT